MHKNNFIVLFTISTITIINVQPQTRTDWSQLHDDIAIPFGDMQIEVTRFSCPFSEPIDNTENWICIECR